MPPGRLLVFYIAAMGDHYAATLSRLGFAQVVAEVRALWAAGRRRDAAAAIPRAMLDAIATASRACHRWQSFAGR